MKKLIFLIMIVNLYAQSLNSLLNKIEKDNDLSQITKQESAGISYVITRYQLDMMQAKYLKDVLKNTAISYHSNRYNLLDPFSLAMSPFGNNNIKIFIDNYEINSMSSENGIFLFSNLPLDFVDHIEIYYFSSADKFFGEPVYAVIKLYSKDPKRDNGLNLNASISEITNSQSLAIGDYKTNPYYLYVSKNKVNLKIKNDEKLISKDSDTYHIFAKTKNNYGDFMFNAIIDDRAGFMGMSLDGKPDVSTLQNKQFLIGYENTFKKLKVNYTLSYQQSNEEFEENPQPLFVTNKYIPVHFMNTKGENFTNYLKLSLDILNNETSKIDGGILLKNEKNFNIDYKINNQQKFNGIRNQTKYTAFINNRYHYLSNSILDTSLSYSIYDNDVTDDFYLLNVKIGNSYFYNNSNIFKLFYFHIENSPPNYLINSIFQNKKLIPTISNSYVFKYKKKVNESNNFFITFVTGDSTKQIISKNNGLENSNEKIKLNFIDMRWSKDYNYINNFLIEGFIFWLDNARLKQHHQVSVLNTHRYKKFDFFENIIYKKLTFTSDTNSGFDLDLGVSYNLNDNLMISLKGESLLSTRYEEEYMRYDISKMTFLDPLKTPAIPRNISLSVEYSF